MDIAGWLSASTRMFIRTSLYIDLNIHLIGLSQLCPEYIFCIYNLTTNFGNPGLLHYYLARLLIIVLTVVLFSVTLSGILAIGGTPLHCACIADGGQLNPE